jgi:hypothetical protein
MKATSFWILLAATVILLGRLGVDYAAHVLEKRFEVGDATIRIRVGDPNYLSDEVVTQYVRFALLSNSIDPANWSFVPVLQDSNTMVSRSGKGSNFASLQLRRVNTNAVVPGIGDKLRVSLEVTNFNVRIKLRRPK